MVNVGFFSAETLISASSIPQCSGGVVVVTLLHSTQSGVRNTNMTFYYVDRSLPAWMKN